MEQSHHTHIGTRLRHEMKKKGMSAVDLAKIADVKTSFLYDVISGKSANPSSIKLAKVADSLGVSLTYLAGTSDSPNEGYQFSLPHQLQDYVSISSLAVADGKVISSDAQASPFLMKKSWITDNFRIVPQDSKVMVVQGDNMHPTLRHHDTILINTNQKHPSPPGIFVLFDGTGLSIRRLELLGGSQQHTIRVSCDNPQYSTYDSPAEEMAILGRVIWFSRDI